LLHWQGVISKRLRPHLRPRPPCIVAARIPSATTQASLVSGVNASPKPRSSVHSSVAQFYIDFDRPSVGWCPALEENMTRHFAQFTLAATVLLAACTQQPATPAEPPDTRAQDESAIRAAVKDWSAAAAAKDPTKFASFYTDDGMVMLEGAPLISGRTAIAETLTPMMKDDPNFGLTFETVKVEVARSSDIAYETGTYQMTTSDPKTKKPAPVKGKYVVVWKKVGGTWKAAVDAPVSGR
jgi:uncharacterized protein (TIGR02246 family)